MTTPDANVIPFRRRRYDWFLVAALAMFATTSFTVDLVNLLFRPDADSGFALARFVHDSYAAGADPLLAANPRFVQTASGISAVVFGTYYVAAIYAFIRGRDWIRLPTFLYAGMIVQSTALFLTVGLVGDAPLFRTVCGSAYSGFDYTFTDVPKVVFGNVPYIVVPLLLVVRMWRPKPFGRAGRAMGW